MTVNKLHKLLEEIIEKGHGRKRVCVNKETFSHPLEQDGAVILNVESVAVQSIPMIDDDGWTKILADGSESYNTVLVISGS